MVRIDMADILDLNRSVPVCGDAVIMFVGNSIMD
jgi:hypothetical protein